MAYLESVHNKPLTGHGKTDLSGLGNKFIIQVKSLGCTMIYLGLYSIQPSTLDLRWNTTWGKSCIPLIEPG